ncbi:CaiB/BaiF CoA transferase family protein [Natronolimnohabitans innermongolicus]|uniref:Crotonobetainyl-CoA:carnitine CoA-transferase /alpha-methylacyl-CoA racemase 1 n=1 Tax=Natronolimnohabitans innermongolicus JCM 12255 TaxID=1227499 RepID=L9WLX9_9EURY|nr:CoA transferase [Natronolimnohabitans innermongolicus]ELY50469.1 crotonobetainyl-CoA:carnitine CoA-transferase /alpha-methylacyl-CoA racemase 1 [Natronolimnohabitans innermongolicus JCM 12255]
MDAAGRTESGALPLEGITVVDLTQVVAGPFTTMMLGDLGAEVIKIEAVGRGDRSRSIQPNPAYFDSVNRNKHSVALDLKSDAGQRAAQRLIADADVFVESTKPGRAAAFNLDYETVSELNPELIYCSIVGFGRDSPYEELPAWDMLIQGMSGIMSITGEEGGEPLWSGLPSGDLIAGSYASQSVLAALYARERGRIDGEWIEVPMLDAAISWLTARAGHTFGSGDPFPRLGTHHPSIVPFGKYECADRPIIVAAGTADFWRGFCRAIDRPELLDDDRFATMDDRVDNRAELAEIVEPILRGEESDYWIDRFHAEDVPAGPIYDTKSVWDDDHVQRRALHKTMERDDRADADVIDHPVHFTALTTQLEVAPERLGESTDSILERHGYSPEEIETLREEGVLE